VVKIVVEFPAVGRRSAASIFAWA